MATRNILPPVARVAILRAIRLLDSVAFVSQPGDAARPLAILRNAIELDELAKREAERAPAAPDWQSIAAQHARQRDAAMAERNASRDDVFALADMVNALQAERDALRAAFDERTDALRERGDELMAATNERDALRRQLAAMREAAGKRAAAGFAAMADAAQSFEPEDDGASFRADRAAADPGVAPCNAIPDATPRLDGKNGYR